MSNIRDREQFMNSLVDWAPLNSCFGNFGIRPSDTDGEVERKDRYLVLEGKPADKTGLTNGFLRRIRSRVWHGDTWAIVIWCDRDPDGVASLRLVRRLRVFRSDGEHNIAPATMSDLQRICGPGEGSWMQWADTRGYLKLLPLESICRQCGAAVEDNPFDRLCNRCADVEAVR